MIIKFFDIFLKLEELVNSASFQEFDPAHTGWITTQDLKKAMEAQKIYDADQVSNDEILFPLSGISAPSQFSLRRGEKAQFINAHGSRCVAFPDLTSTCFFLTPK